MKCIYCSSANLYELQNGYFKCAKCKRKFSPFKVEREKNIITLFCKGLSALQASKESGFTYTTVQKKFMLYRHKIISYEDKKFENKTSVNEYDEYIYLERRKRRDKRYIFDAKNFLTFDYDNGKIYNMLLPELSRFKESFLEDNLDDTYYKEFSKYLKWHRVSNLKNRQNNITKFWDFFENQIIKFKGIKSRNFFFYLKEIEFRYNYSMIDCGKILYKLCMPHHA